MGTSVRARAVLDGASVAGVVDVGKNAVQRLACVGDGGGRAPVENAAVTPYEIAKAGGKHAGLLRRYGTESRYAIDKNIRSLERQISAHEAKLFDPVQFVEPGTSSDELRYLTQSK